MSTAANVPDAARVKVPFSLLGALMIRRGTRRPDRLNISIESI